MDRFRIEGPVVLRGRVRASGAKNAALPALAACLLATEPVELSRMPRVRDIRTMCRLLDHLGVTTEEGDRGTLLLTPQTASPREAPYELVKTMRAGVLSLGPLLAGRGRARVSLPGGCAIGVRPIDQHLAGLTALGAEVRVEGGYVEASVPGLAGRLRGGRFRFALPTVTGTENVLMAAVLAEGTSVLQNCAREPEISDLARLLSAMGGRIEGAGTETITVHGVDRLGGARHKIIPDRIEGGTYLIGAALTGGDVTLEEAEPADLAPLLEKLAEVGAAVETGEQRVRVAAAGAELRSADVETAPHPRFPTDLQAQYLALMTQARGVAVVSETVFENRFQHVPELSRLGAVIEVRGGTARVHGPTALTGAHVMATDLRASACLVLAALAARGETLIHRIYHLDRGYEGMEGKLQSLGATVERVPGPDLD
ncbi:MAG TPA: UDP-N-acetylglucosamine 1-carboxyvinyltransferase [Thermoanaerobaculia bacterium]|nr:UDP-N-acetylglucosamine 1-carboxyvinyltransferase [Thermoanaerobaculia bacterium]